MAREYRRSHDRRIANLLVVSNLRFVIELAHRFSGYGVPLADLIQEGNLGLMRAVQKFDPEQGTRLVTYAAWWIRSYMQNFVLRSWSMVKLGTSQSERRMCFRLRSARGSANTRANGDTQSSTEMLVNTFHEPEKVILELENRLAGDLSLDAPIANHGGATHVNAVVSTAPDSETLCVDRDLCTRVRWATSRARFRLNEREQYVMDRRLLSEEPETLKSIGDRFGVSRERVRQIERKLLNKLRSAPEMAALRDLAA